MNYSILIVWFVRKIKVFLINNNTLFIMKKNIIYKRQLNKSEAISEKNYLNNE